MGRAKRPAASARRGGLYEQALAAAIKKAGFLVIPEFRFHETRRFRFDLAIPSRGVAVEVEGATWVKGGHSTGKGIARDAEKANLAVSLGWRLLRYTTTQLRDNFGDCLDQILEVVNNASHSSVIRPNHPHSRVSNRLGGNNPPARRTNQRARG